MLECLDPHHQHNRNLDIWHVWYDDKGRRFAKECPIYLERAKALKQEQDQLLNRKEDWWSK